MRNIILFGNLPALLFQSNCDLIPTPELYYMYPKGALRSIS